jgi:hypothetical protein
MSSHDEEEAVGLVSQDIKSKPEISNHGRRNKAIFSCLSCLLLGSSLSVGLITLLQRSPAQPNGNNSENTIQRQSTGDPYPQFSCPKEVQQAQDVDTESFEEVYTNVSEHIIEDNITAFLEGFRDREFDGWGLSYKEVKEGLHDWKVKHYAANLKDGDSIFESACGIGLNLALTLESVQEAESKHNLKVYGNEYVAESAKLANKILDTLLPQINATKGTICQGDSTNLKFIPSDSFDLVFTGYIRYVSVFQCCSDHLEVHLLF